MTEPPDFGEMLEMFKHVIEEVLDDPDAFEAMKKKAAAFQTEMLVNGTATDPDTGMQVKFTKDGGIEVKMPGEKPLHVSPTNPNGETRACDVERAHHGHEYPLWNGTLQTRWCDGVQ